MSRIRFTTTLSPASTTVSSLNRAKVFLDTNCSIGIAQICQHQTGVASTD